MDKRLVVVVDDDRTIRDVLTEILTAEGYRVESIGDGPTAINRVREIALKRGPIAAITLDLSLPGKDGATILRELKDEALTRHIPVVVVSATPQLLPVERRPLAAAVVRKPFDIMHLLDTIATAAGKQTSSGKALPSTPLANEMARP